MQPPYTNASKNLCIRLPICKCPSQDIIGSNVRFGDNNIILIDINNYSNWVGADITVIGTSTPIGIFDKPMSHFPTTVPVNTNGFTLTIEDPPNNIVGIVKFTLANRCQFSFTYINFDF
jgi:hypothetical protein